MGGDRSAHNYMLWNELNKTEVLIDGNRTLTTQFLFLQCFFLRLLSISIAVLSSVQWSFGPSDLDMQVFLALNIMMF